MQWRVRAVTSIDLSDQQAQALGHPPPGGTPGASKPAWRRHLGFGNIGVVYVEIGLIIIFSIWAPSTFPTFTTVKSVLNQNAIAGLMALSLVVPLSARVFDLSIGNAMGLANVLVAWLLVDKGFGIGPAIVVTLLLGLGIGLLNGLVVVSARIDSFIGTLATGSLMAAAISLVSNDQTIIGSQLNGSFGNFATISVGGIELPVLLMLAVAIVLWFIQRYTVLGRRIYAIGFNERGASLAGIRTGRIKFATLIVSGLVAAIAGVLLASSVSSGSPGIGPPYLLNAFAAAFLGSTQFGGRFNAWGTVLAVILLGTGTTGLVLVGGAPWTQSMFSGVVLLVALGASSFERAVQARTWIKARRRRRGAAAAKQAVGVLIVANQTAASDELAAAVRERAQRSPASFHLLVPGLSAEAVLAAALPKLTEAAGGAVTGATTGEEPLDAIKDAIARGGFEEVIVSTLPETVSKWLKLDLVSRVRRLDLPVTHIEAKAAESAHAVRGPTA
jgi:ribose transport system permease protein